MVLILLLATVLQLVCSCRISACTLGNSGEFYHLQQLLFPALLFIVRTMRMIHILVYSSTLLLYDTTRPRRPGWGLTPATPGSGEVLRIYVEAQRVKEGYRCGAKGEDGCGRVEKLA